MLHRLRDTVLKGILNYNTEGSLDNVSCDSNLNHLFGTVSSMFLLPPGSVSISFIEFCDLLKLDMLNLGLKLDWCDNRLVFYA